MPKKAIYNLYNPLREMDNATGEDSSRSLRPRPGCQGNPAPASEGAGDMPDQTAEDSTVDTQPVLIVLRCAAEIMGLACSAAMSKEDIVTAMLASWAPHRLSEPDHAPHVVRTSRNRGKRMQNLHGPPIARDSFLEALHRNPVHRAAYCVQRDNVPWGIHPGDAIRYWERQSAGPKQVYGAVRGFRSAVMAQRTISTEVEIQRLYTQEELATILNTFSPVPEGIEDLAKHFTSELEVAPGPALVMVVLSEWVNSVPLKSIVSVHALAPYYKTRNPSASLRRQRTRPHFSWRIRVSSTQSTGRCTPSTFRPTR